jgi:hypothetical protein
LRAGFLSALFLLIYRLPHPASTFSGRRRLRTQTAAKAQDVRVFAQRGDAESNVLFEGDAEFFGAFADIVARDSAGEGFVFHAFLN